MSLCVCKIVAKNAISGVYWQMQAKKCEKVHNIADLQSFF